LSTSTVSTSEPKQRNGRRRRWMIGAACVFLVILLIYFLYWLVWGQFEVYTNDAYVTGNMVQVMPQVPGTVVALYTDETKFVKQGQPLVGLDTTDAAVTLAQAKANLAQTVRQVREDYSNATEAFHTLTLRRADLMQATADFARRKDLVQAHVISPEELEHFQVAFIESRAQYQVAVSQWQAALALVNHTHLYTHPLVQQAKVALLTAYLNNSRTMIVSPVAGFVANRAVQLGQYVNPDSNLPLMNVVPLNDVWVDANYKENQLSTLRIGQPVTLQADAYSGVTYHGHVVGLVPGTGAVFSLLPPQNATGNWIKILQRVPVRISLDPNELKSHPLVLGLSMSVTVDIHDTSGKRLATVEAPRILYQTRSYEDQLAGARQLIDSILHQNSPNMAFDSP